MRWQGSLLSLLVLAAPGFAQETTPQPVGTAPLLLPVSDEVVGSCPLLNFGSTERNQNALLAGDHGFPNFIGFISNPTLNLDPRALTQMWPLFAGAWTDKTGPIPGGESQVYGPGLSVALTDRLEVGFNKGGYAVAKYDKDREGWLDLGGFVQYTLIRNVESQFLLSVGLQWSAPTGESSVFQGDGPAYLTPYLTFGKEFGNFHVLGTTGYNFPLETGFTTKETFYTDLHLDYRVCSWLYGVVEFNGAYATAHVDFTKLNRPDLIDFGRFDATGTQVNIAPGFNAVLIPDHLEFGAAYQTPLYAEHDFRYSALIVKMILRY